MQITKYILFIVAISLSQANGSIHRLILEDSINSKSLSSWSEEKAIDNESNRPSGQAKSIINVLIQIMLDQARGAPIDPMQILSLLPDLKSILSDPATLVSATKLASNYIDNEFAASILPGPAYEVFVDFKKKQPNDIYEYVTNRVVETSVITDLGTKANKLLDIAGLEEENTRKETLCYIGSTVSNIYPGPVSGIVEWLTTEASMKNLRRKAYIDAFITGLVERRCSKWRSSCEKAEEL